MKEVGNLKKFITIILGALFVLGLSATAFAIHAEIPAETQAVVAKGVTQITLGGNIRVRGWYLNDIVDTTLEVLTEGELEGATRLPADVGSSSYYDERVRLSIDAASGSTTGRIHLESNSGNKDTWTWGGDPDTFDSKPTDVHILEAWIQHKFDAGFPVGVKIGHMPLVLGPAKLFYDHTKFGDDAIIVFSDPTPNTHIALLTIKVDEGTSVATIGDLVGGNVSNADDADAYVALLNHKLGNTTLGAYYVYINSSDVGTKLQDVGVHAAGSVAGLTYTAQADLNFGDAVEILGTEIEAKGWAAWLELGYKIDPIGIRVMGAMGSGDEDPFDDEIEGFINFLGSNRYYTVVYDYQLAGANLVRYQGVSNTTVLNAGIDLKPTDKLALSVDGYWLQATETEWIETLSEQSVDDDLGWEVDVKASYDLAKNLKYFVWAGYMKTGDFYEDVFGPDFDKDPTVVMHGIEYAF